MLTRVDSTNILNTTRCHNLEFRNIILPKYFSDIKAQPALDNNKSFEDFRTREEQREKIYNEKEDKIKEEEEMKKTEDEERLANVKNKILQEALQFVPSDGWTKDALSRGAESLGYAGVTHGMFPNGPADLIEYFYKTSNDKLVELMKIELNGKPKPANTHDFMVKAIRLRLEMILPYINSWPKAMAIMTLPSNVQLTLANLLMLSDDICYFLGDRSVDVSMNIV